MSFVRMTAEIKNSHSQSQLFLCPTAYLFVTLTSSLSSSFSFTLVWSGLFAAHIKPCSQPPGGTV